MFQIDRRAQQWASLLYSFHIGLSSALEAAHNLSVLAANMNFLRSPVLQPLAFFASLKPMQTKPDGLYLIALEGLAYPYLGSTGVDRTLQGQIVSATDWQSHPLYQERRL